MSSKRAGVSNIHPSKVSKLAGHLTPAAHGGVPQRDGESQIPKQNAEPSPRKNSMSWTKLVAKVVFIIFRLSNKTQRVSGQNPLLMSGSVWIAVIQIHHVTTRHCEKTFRVTFTRNENIKKTINVLFCITFVHYFCGVVINVIHCRKSLFIAIRNFFKVGQLYCSQLKRANNPSYPLQRLILTFGKEDA